MHRLPVQASSSAYCCKWRRSPCVRSTLARSHPPHWYAYCLQRRTVARRMSIFRSRCGSRVVLENQQAGLQW